ncbi:MAG: hemolysin III family protein [Eubacterium sp.]
MSRVKLKDRVLPSYTKGEEIFNMVSHIVGGAIGIAVLVLCIIQAAVNGTAWGVVSSAIYGASMIIVYTISSIYHGLTPPTAKKVFRILDHCDIYLLIAGTYTPVALAGIRPVYPVTGWIIFGIVWGCAALAITLTAIDMEKYQVFSMICYLVMGWCIIFFFSKTYSVLGMRGIILLVAGGIAYTVGAILYGIGKKHKYMHSIFHLFIVAGSILQFFAILFYVLPTK